MFNKLPTAWLQLSYYKSKLLVAIGGITFIISLIFMQLGFQTAFIDGAVRLPDSIQGDIFLMSSRSNSMISLTNFSDRHLVRALAFPEVDYITPIYVDSAQWRNPQNKKLWRKIYVLGLTLDRNILNLPGIAANLDKLKITDVVLFDRNSRAEYGDVPSLLSQQDVTTEVRGKSISDRKVSIGGLFSLGTSFGIDGTIVTSDLNFLRIFSSRQKGFINLGVVKLKPDSDLDSVIAQMRSIFPQDLKIIAKTELLRTERSYWQKRTSIGFIFNLILAGSIIVGIVIIYQILHSNISDCLVEFATLKAIGYPHNYLLNVVYQEAIILSLLGYFPGFVISLFVYQFSRNATNLPIFMDASKALLVLAIALIITTISGAITIQKLKHANPADIFG
ncbi:MAG: ABC transporter permease DevC [Cyanobacteria bacterium P01_C01_bin.72]